MYDADVRGKVVLPLSVSLIHTLVQSVRNGIMSCIESKNLRGACHHQCYNCIYSLCLLVFPDSKELFYQF